MRHFRNFKITVMGRDKSKLTYSGTYESIQACFDNYQRQLNHDWARIIQIKEVRPRWEKVARAALDYKQRASGEGNSDEG